jgi:predicted O-methyltransferase YrrM
MGHPPKRLYADPDFLTSIIPIRDGLAVAVKL